MLSRCSREDPPPGASQARRRAQANEDLKPTPQTISARGREGGSGSDKPRDESFAHIPAQNKHSVRSLWLRRSYFRPGLARVSAFTARSVD